MPVRHLRNLGHAEGGIEAPALEVGVGNERPCPSLAAVQVLDVHPAHGRLVAPQNPPANLILEAFEVAHGQLPVGVFDEALDGGVQDACGGAHGQRRTAVLATKRAGHVVQVLGGAERSDLEHYFFFFLARSSSEYSMATACLTGRPEFTSSAMFLDLFFGPGFSSSMVFSLLLGLGLNLSHGPQEQSGRGVVAVVV